MEKIVTVIKITQTDEELSGINGLNQALKL